MAALAASWKGRRLTVGFVPTMGALHHGHASLIRRAAAENDRTVVSIFVNPAQFGPNEDFARYPRTLAADRRLCLREKADAVFVPASEEMYPEGFATYACVEGLSDRLCGAFRPGHFRGVATVVLKLFNIVRPDRAYFGEKDYQQLVVIRRMARDLAVPVEVVACPTVRESDGLAMSSRNRYLEPEARAAAPILHGALAWGALKARAGLAPRRVVSGVRARLGRMPGVSIDYVRLVDPLTLEDARAPRRPLPAGRGTGLRLLAAVRLAGTRLIDNIDVS